MEDTTGWYAEAACRERGPDDFFPDDEDSDNHGRAAKAVCASCPVRELCLVASLERGEEFGIWGGAGGSARRALARAFSRRHLKAKDWVQTLGEHWARLDGEHVGPVLAFGEGATHGLAATYAKGCRCELCTQAARCRTADSTYDKRARRVA